MDRIKNRLREERIDVGQPIRSMSYNVPGHEERLKSHEKRIHTEIGPMMYNYGKMVCGCVICQRYVNTRTMGPKYDSMNEEIEKLKDE